MHASSRDRGLGPASAELEAAARSMQPIYLAGTHEAEALKGSRAPDVGEKLTKRVPACSTGRLRDASSETARRTDAHREGRALNGAHKARASEKAAEGETSCETGEARESESALS